MVKRPGRRTSRAARVISYCACPGSRRGFFIPRCQLGNTQVLTLCYSPTMDKIYKSVAYLKELRKRTENRDLWKRLPVCGVCGKKVGMILLYGECKKDNCPVKQK